MEVVDEDGEEDDGGSEQKEGDVLICKSIIDDEDGEDDEEGTEQKEGGVPTFKRTVKGITYNSSHDKEEKDNKTNPDSGGCIGGEHTHGEICKGLHGFFWVCGILKYWRSWLYTKDVFPCTSVSVRGERIG